MATEERPDWLPEGWTMGVRTTRSGLMHPYYVSLESRRIFSSKTDVLNYMNNEKPSKHTSRGSPQYIEDKKQIPQAESSTDWLPNGWILEIKAPKWGRRKHKCYFHPSTGTKCYSKPEVMRFLRKGEQCSTSDQEKGPDANPSNNVQTHIQHSPESIHKECSKKVKFRKITLKKAGIQGQSHPASSQENNLEGTLKRCLLSGEQDTITEDVKTRRGMVSVSENAELIFTEQSDSENVNRMPLDSSDRVPVGVGKLEELAVNESSYMHEIKQHNPDRSAPLQVKFDGRGNSLSSSGELDLNLPDEKSSKKVERHGRKSKAQKSNSIPLRASKRRARSEAYSDLSVQLGATSDKEFDSISKIEIEMKIKDVPEIRGDGKRNELQVPEWESWSDPCIKFALKTLTSDISFLNNIEEYFRQQLASIDSPCSNGSATNNGKLTAEKDMKSRSSGNGLKNFFDLNKICQSTGSQEN